MSFWQLIKMFVRVLMGHRRYQRGMDQLRTSSLRLKAIDETLAAYRKGDFEEGLRIAETMKGNPMLQGPYLFFSGTMLMHLGRFQEAEQRLRRNLTAQTGAQSTALAYSSLDNCCSNCSATTKPWNVLRPACGIGRSAVPGIGT